ncbi:MAG TPA: hypothetical protein VMW50_03490 [Dehalococcoidia bacterium]|nr:hypothetical protein [Dehalococcoidia bacterium]
MLIKSIQESTLNLLEESLETGKMKTYICGHLHCPSCKNQLDIDLVCSVCGKAWTERIIEQYIGTVQIDITKLYEDKL